MYETELAFADELADAAAEIAMSLFRREFEVRTKDDLTPVTEADTRVEEMIRNRLADRFPDDAVLGEEGGLHGSGNRVWVIDPIDGTKNFAAGIQIWATLIALVENEEPVLGLAGAPALGERYHAARGGGARMNGELIHVSQVEDLSRALVCSSGGKDWLDGPHAEGYRGIATEAARTRAFGDFWGHMLVARGSAEVMLEPALRTWDWTALTVIVEEAGGRMTALDGGPLTDRGSALATNGLLHDEVVRRFR